MFDHKRVKNSLNNLGKSCQKILLQSATAIVLPNAIATVETTRKAYDYAKRNHTRGFEPGSWGYTIDHAQPLRFKPSTILGIELNIDLYCDVKWKESELPIEQDIKIRIWSDHDNLIFRENKDSPQILEALASPDRSHNGRVISRFHFDKANKGQQAGPNYHFQIGGISEEYELCWYPSTVNLPRIVHAPMELFLACQLVAANFFWDEYLEIREKSEWRYEVKQYERMLLKQYYDSCRRAIDGEDSVLDGLWVI